MCKIVYGLIFLILLYACNSTKETTIILDKHVDELFALAKEKNQLLCLFLGGGEQCNNCTYKMKELQQKGILADFDKDYIFASCNAGETKDAYLHHCLIMIGLPTIYIFSPEGRLLSFMYNLSEPELVHVLLESTLGGDPSPLVKHPQFQSGFQDLLNMQNLVLQAYRESERAANDTLKLQNALAYIQQAIAIEPYFFNLYLSAAINRKLGNNEVADSYTYQALTVCKDGFQQAVYASYIQELKKQCPRFLEEEGLKSHLFLENRILDCGDLDYNTTKEFVFKYTNDGKQPLIISHVSSACNCITPQWSKEPLLPGKQGEIKITYKADKKGKFSRTVFVMSNASNQVEQFILEGCTK